MFQQFKRLIPATSLNFKDLTKAVGINEEDLKANFHAVRSELQNINALLLNLPPPSPTFSSLRGSRPQSLSDSFSDSRHSDTSTLSHKEPKTIKGPDITATLELASRLASEWDDIHHGNEINFCKAAQAGDLLHRVLEGCNAHFEACETLRQESDNLAQVRLNLEEMTQSAVALKGQLTALETLIDQMSVGYEERRFEEWRAEQEAELKRYKEEKTQDLEARRANLDRQYHEHARDQAARRVELYQANFEAEVQNYRKRKETEVRALDAGLPSHVTTVTAKPTGPPLALETLSLQDHAADTGELDNFLAAEERLALAIPRPVGLVLGDDDDDDDDTSAGLVLADEDYQEG